MNTLLFISRHDPTDAQVKLAEILGYDNLKRVDLVFNNDPIGQLLELGINRVNSSHLAIVAPLNISLILLRAKYSLIEFQNCPSARGKGIFLCKGAWVHQMNKSVFIPCPIPLELQEEGILLARGA